jgi:hypothetical protein
MWPCSQKEYKKGPKDQAIFVLLMNLLFFKKTCRPAQKPLPWDKCEPTGQLISLIAGQVKRHGFFFFQQKI